MFEATGNRIVMIKNGNLESDLDLSKRAFYVHVKGVPVSFQGSSSAYVRLDGVSKASWTFKIPTGTPLKSGQGFYFRSRDLF